jgi:hypothetical protein
MLAIGGAGILLGLVLRPFQPTPFIDDWSYAFPVQQLIETGQLRIPEYSNPSLVLMLYGVAWCLPFGFSFVTLGISTWTLWIALQVGTYLLVLELGGSRRNALTAAAVVAFFPTCFALAPTFMSDVPFLAAETWSVLFFVRGLNRCNGRSIWIAALLACAAIGIRMVGLALPCAMIAVLLTHTESWGRRARLLVAPLLSLPFAAVMLVLTAAFSFPSADVSYLPGSPPNRISNLPIALEILPKMLAPTIAHAFLEAGIAILPAAMGSRPRTRGRLFWSIAASIALALSAAPFTDWIPFGKGNLWHIGEVWATPGLVPGWTPRFEFPASVRLLTRVAGFASIAILIANFRDYTARNADWFIAWTFAGLALMSALLWLFNNDRYGLIYIPIASAFLLSRAEPVRRLPAVSGIAMYAAFSVIATIDHKAYNDALWSTVDRLREEGVPVAEIDGGYTVNAWLQYVRPEQAHRESDGRITIPFLNAEPEVTYTISNSPIASGRIVETVPYRGWLSSGNLYVLKRGT